MKTKLIVCITLLFLICTGCKKHECNTLSWTDYNSVEDVWCNFRYFKEESKTNIGDTLRVYGWLTDSLSNVTQWCALTSVKELQFSHNGSAIYSNPFVSLFISQNIIPILQSIPLDSLLYITGIIENELEVGLYLDVTRIDNK